MKVSLYPSLPVLMVDDEAQALDSFETALLLASINNIIRCQDSRDVMQLLSTKEIEVMLLDLSMPHISGEELLSLVTKDFPEIPVIIITGSNDVETAVACMKSGAFDYMVKPVEKSRLISGVKRAIELRELQSENRLLKAHVLFDQLEHPEAFSEIITDSETMRSIFQYVEAISNTSQPVLITGETGVGKELVARAIHKLSNRKGDFVPVNVAGLDDNIFADTLFGHKRGAFTGADQPRSGMIEQASGGTLFLDEIGDLSPPSQVKLLRLLQDGEFFPLGSDISKHSDARVVVATNQNLQALQESGKFRKDLYYRLRAHHIHIPPLRDRYADLPVLVNHFLEKASKTLGKEKPTPPEELIALLATYPFPGNVRELESMIFDVVTSCKTERLPLELFKLYIRQDESVAKSEATGQPDAAATLKEKIETVSHMTEKQMIIDALNKTSQNRTKAARLLGISRRTLQNKIKEYCL
jgi:two-component system nitrogen regulation response regulator GlnG